MFFLFNFDQDEKTQTLQIRPKIGGCEEIHVETKNEVQVMRDLITDTPA